ncbi:MAG: hypothetical protein A1D16_09305 [Flavihumibacter sp. CACIAM 22H1]|nr:MAG: hypothetical protein A1D16_09305 [Flavihumibacter sp. CACIAM 22H1]
MLALLSCDPAVKKKQDESSKPGDFGYDKAFLQTHLPEMILLYGDDSLHQKILVAPEYQGRVMTSTIAGDEGISLGWINHHVIAQKKPEPHITAVGGEDRFWLGPEGGQFSVYFKQDAPFVFENWQVSLALDTEPFIVVRKTAHEVQFEKTIQLTNYSGKELTVRVDRTVKVLSNLDMTQMIGLPLDGVQMVGFTSVNTIWNAGKEDWTRSTGALSIWILGMMKAAENTRIIVPLQQGASPGKGITTNYFGEIPPERLTIDSVSLQLKADGKYRAKIGISQSVAKSWIGSYDEENELLTLVHYNLPSDPLPYVNSLWEIQQQPFSGDVVNAYNDGPVKGKQLGDFYELETSSPAALLKKEEAITHRHTTIHVSGTKEQLNTIAIKLLGTPLN